MTPIPLDQIGLRWQDHRSALWWLRLLYLRPAYFQKSLINGSRWKTATISLKLYIHILPYMVILATLGRLFIFELFHLPRNQSPSYNLTTLPFHIYSLFGGIILWFILGCAFGIVRSIWGRANSGIASGIVLGIAGGIMSGSIAGLGDKAEIFGWTVIGIFLGIIVGIARGISRETAVGINFGIGFGVIGGTFAGMAAGDTTGVAGGVITGITFAISSVTFLLRLYYQLINLVIVWPKPRAHLYGYHPLAWDDMCSVPFFELRYLLVSLAEETLHQGEAEIDRLITTYPSQRNEALRAKVILLARISSRLLDLSKLDEIGAQLPNGKKGFLNQTQELWAWASEISRLQIRLNTINRPVLREPTAELLVKEIENFRHRVAGLHEPLATEFRAAATQWLAIAQGQLDEARRSTTRELTPQVFRAGDPVDREQEAFVLRYAVIGELERQIMLSTGCPGIVLYGRKRTGKSTILRNLTGFLPTDVVTALFSMQKPHLFTSLESAVRAISHEIQKQLPASNIGADSVADLRGFYDLLTRCNEQLETDGKRLMLAVDEYENIDAKIGEGIFPRDLLDTIRESIQTHRRITWIFAGSHEIYELKNAAWTSYLVSARTIEVPSFTLAETRLLLTEPLKHSSLWQGNEAKRPRFDASFWGEGGIERIHSEAGGWPHLVQLIVETIVDVLNNEEASEVTPELMERALDKSIVSGQIVLYQLMHDESTLPGEWEYLSAFRKRETQAPPDDESVAASLRRRLLIAEHNDEWRLRVPLMARWLKVRGQ